MQIILKRDDLKVTSVSSQYVIKNLQGRSVRLDILAVDRQNQVYNIEIQRDDKGAGVKRARYNSSLIDANVTEPGEQYQNLNETYVVFITENDVLGENIPIYHVDRIVRETGKMFNDQSHIIYVNSQIKDETALGKLMHDFTCTNAKDMYYEVLADRVHYFKEDEKGVATMCRAMEEMRNETARETEHAKAINKAIFPGTQGGPLMHVIAGKAVCFKEALQPEYKTYMEQVVRNAKALCNGLKSRGVKIVSGDTDNHLMLVDLSGTDISGKELEKRLDDAHVTANKNTIPNDPRSPFVTSGVRLGTPAVTTRGMKEEDMDKIAEIIAMVIESEDNVEKAKAMVAELTAKYPLC